MSSATSQYCPNCGASNPIDATECRVCGQFLPSEEERQALWATRADASSDNDPTAPGAVGDGDRGDTPAQGDQPRPSWEQQDTQPLETPATGLAGSDEQRNAPESPPWSAGGTSNDSQSGWGATRDTPDAGSAARTWPGGGQPWGEQAEPYRAPDPAGQASPSGDPAGSGAWPSAGYDEERYGPEAAGWAAPPPGAVGSGQSPYGPGAAPTGRYPAGGPQWGPTGYAPPVDAAPGGPPNAGPPMAPGAQAGQPRGPGGPAGIATGSRGPSGCLLGGLGVVLIALAVAVLVGLVVVNNATGSHLRGNLQDVAATQVASLGPVAVPADGRLTVSAADLTSAIREHTDQYGAINDPTIAIAPDGITLDFRVVGVGSSYHAGVAAENGRLRLTNPTASGAAARVLSAGDMAAVVEPSLNQILMQSGLEATGVDLGQGQLTIMTRPVAGAAGRSTPAAMPAAPSASPARSGVATPTGAQSGTPSPSGQLRPSGSTRPSPSASLRPSVSPTASPSASAPPSGSRGLGEFLGAASSPSGSPTHSPSPSPSR